MGFFRKRKKQPLFGVDIVPSCAYCQHNSGKEEEVVCALRQRPQEGEEGLRSCKKYQYDPLRRGASRGPHAPHRTIPARGFSAVTRKAPHKSCGGPFLWRPHAALYRTSSMIRGMVAMDKMVDRHTIPAAAWASPFCRWTYSARLEPTGAAAAMRMALFMSVGTLGENHRTKAVNRGMRSGARR